MSSTSVVLDLACSTPELRGSFRDPLSSLHDADEWSLAPLIDLIAAAWWEHGVSAPFAFELDVAELPNANDVEHVRLELDADTGHYSVSYLTLIRPDEWLVSVSGRLVSTLAHIETSECAVSSLASPAALTDLLQAAHAMIGDARCDERGLRLRVAPAWRRSQHAEHCISPQLVSVALRAPRVFSSASRVLRMRYVEIARPQMLPSALHAALDGSVDFADADGRVMARFRGIEYADATGEVIDAARLQRVAREALGRSVTLDADLFELGVSSLELLRLFHAVREVRRSVPPLGEFLAAPRLARLLEDSSSRPDHLAQVFRREPRHSRAPQPLAAMQRALWLESQKPGRQLAYCEHAAWSLRGPLDRERLARAFGALAQRYESCRTRMSEVGGQLRQHVRQDASVSLQLCEAEADVEAWLARECRQGWSAGEPLLRAQLLCVAREQHVLLVSAHHAVCDGTSCARWLELLGRAYADSLPPSAASLQPRHLARWEELPHVDDELRAGARAWADELAARPGDSELPVDHPRKPETERRAGHVRFALAPAAVTRLERLARLTQQSLESLGLGVFRAALYRWTGQAELAIGVAAAQRWSPLFDDALGCFINVAPLVVEAHGSLMLSELLAACRSQLRAFVARQHVPFAHVLEAAPPALAEHLASCLRGVGFTQRDQSAFALAGIELAALPCEVEFAKLELAAHWLRDEAGLSCCIEYDRALFDAETITDFARRYQRLLLALDESLLECELKALPWLDAHERAIALAHARGPVRERGTEAAPALIGAAMREHAERPALFDADSGRRWSHAQLADAAARLAARIVRTNTSCVAIFMSNTPQWVIAVLGAWHSGAWWVSVDPEQPAIRSGAMLRAVPTRCVLTLAEHAHFVRELGLEPLVIDDGDDVASPLMAASTNPDALAYGVFTSGTTGVPKLALAHHRGLANKLAAQRETFALALAPRTRVLRFASPGFDAALSELLLALAAGAELAIPPRAARYGGCALERWLHAEAIEVAMLTPSVIRSLQPNELPALHTLLAMGERCPRPLVDAWARDGRCVWNLYGPAETTIWTAAARCEAGSEPSIGRAIANVAAYVLDRDLQVVPTGRSGEICVGGVGVGPGYLNDDALTRKRFVANPYAPGERLYRSGDRGRYRADGQLEFSGRLDAEVKLRGRRVALDEIAALLQQRTGAEAAALITAADSERAAVIGFVSAEALTTTAAVALRRELYSVLPRHAVPARLIRVEAWPRSPHGKLDRDALARLAAADSGRDSTPSQPLEAHTQQLVAAAMADVLSIDACSIAADDDFIARGGDSLHVLALSERLLQTTGTAFPLPLLMASPSVRELAAWLDGDAARDELATARADLAWSVPAPTARRAPRPWRCVLVTGGTGRLGAPLMAALLADPELRVVSLCRGNAERALARSGRGLTPEQAARVEVVIGDLRAPLCGLPPPAFAALAERVDAIFHLAADTHLGLPYSALRELNVLGTQRMIELACAGQASELHYVSSLSTLFPSLAAIGGSARERAALTPELLPTGYGQSKAVSERLAARAGERGLKVGIYRPSRLWADEANDSDDVVVRLVRGCAELGVYPDCDLRDNIVSTHVVGRTIVRIARTDNVTQSVFHLVNPRSTPLSAFVAALRALGHRLTAVSADTFCERMTESPSLAALQHLVSSTSLLTTPLPVLDLQHTRAIVPDYECPVLDEGQLIARVKHWVGLPPVLPSLKQSISPA